MNFSETLSIRKPATFRLEEIDPESTPGAKGKEQARARIEKNAAAIDELQYRLFAENKRSLLIVLQAIDAGGKDGAIRTLSRGMNPQGCTVTSFKKPSEVELDHDFLWRVHQAVPRRGEIGIWNRSHYEDVLVVRVHELVPKSVWSARYEQINRFEANLVAADVHILKFLLHISKDEQKERFQARLDDPEKHWKFSPADVEERKHWDAYMKAFETAVRKCHTPEAPWFVIPANKKWYRDLAITEIVRETMESWKMQYPKPSFDPAAIRIE